MHLRLRIRLSSSWFNQYTNTMQQPDLLFGEHSVIPLFASCYVPFCACVVVKWPVAQEGCLQTSATMPTQRHTPSVSRKSSCRVNAFSLILHLDMKNAMLTELRLSLWRSHQIPPPAWYIRLNMPSRYLLVLHISRQIINWIDAQIKQYRINSMGRQTEACFASCIHNWQIHTDQVGCCSSSSRGWMMYPTIWLSKIFAVNVRSKHYQNQHTYSAH